MDQRIALIEAIKEEDRLLRRHLAGLPRDLREHPAPDGGLSLKDILGHIAFWDDFTVRFFRRKLDAASLTPSPPVRFEERSREALWRSRSLPFGEVLARYLEATGGLVEFLARHWDELTEREKCDFRVPLRHRRHHRLEHLAGLARAAGGEDPDLAMSVGA